MEAARPTTAGYAPADAWDEAFEPDGAPRPVYAGPLAALAERDLGTVTADVRATLARRGVGFGGAGDGSPFAVDPVPRVIAADEWDLLRRALEQRAEALAAFVVDVHCDREIVAAGEVPARVVETAEHLEPALTDVPLRGAGWVAGLDLVRGADGRLRVLEDNLRTPSGIAYAIAARAAVDGHLGLVPPRDRLDPRRSIDLLGHALRSSAPADAGDDPAVALLSEGPANSAWYEHRSIAGALGIPIVHPDDLLVRDARVHARVDGGVRALDVVYRRTDEDRLRTADGRPTWLAEKLLEPLRAGTVAVVNPFGAGVADDKLAHAYVERMIHFYRGEEPLIESVRTYDLGDGDTLAEVLERLDELVVKPRSGYGGAGVVVGPHATAAAREDLRRSVAAQPEDYVAQETVPLSTHPTVCDGRLEPRHVDLRPFVVGVGMSATAAPAALTRVAFEAGELVVNSSQDGGGKDTWLLG